MTRFDWLIHNVANASIKSIATWLHISRTYNVFYSSLFVLCHTYQTLDFLMPNLVYTLSMNYQRVLSKVQRTVKSRHQVNKQLGSTIDHVLLNLEHDSNPMVTTP